RDFAAHSTPQQFRKDIGYLTGGYEGEQAYLERARAQQEAWPLLSSLSYGIGQAVGMAPVLAAGAGAAAGRLGLAAMGAAEGAASGVLAPYEQASIDNTPVTRGALLASGLLGAVVGGVAGAAAPTIGAVAGRGRDLVTRVFGRETVEQAAKQTDDAARRLTNIFDDQPAEVLDDVIRRVAPDAPEGTAAQVRAVREQLEDLTERMAQAANDAGPNPLAQEDAIAREAATGRNRLRELAGDMTPDEWTKELSDVGYFVHRDTIVDGATRSVSNDLDTLITASREATEPIRQAPLKRELVKKNREGIDETAAIAAAQARARARAQAVAELRSSGRFADMNKTLRSLWETARKAVVDLDTVQDAADAYLLEDQARRELYRMVVALKPATRSAYAHRNRQAAELLQWAEQEYRDTASMLFDGELWGRQGDIQKRVNLGWVEAIEANRVGMRHFTSEVGRDFYDQAVYGADPDKIRAYLDRLGSQTLRDREIRGILDTQEELLSAIGEGYELDKPARESLGEALEAIRRMRETLTLAADRAARANTIRRINSAEAATLMGRMGAILAGAAREGARGAALGALFPAGLAGAIQTAGALRTIADTTQGRIASWMANIVERLVGGSTPVGGAARRQAETVRATRMLTPEGERMAERVRDWAFGAGVGAAGVSARLFASSKGKERKEKLETYRQRRDVLARLTTQPEATHTALVEAFGPVVDRSPTLGAQLVMDALARLQRLHDAWPGRRELSPVPAAARDVVSDDQLRQAEALWEATFDPWSVFEDFAKGSVDYDKVRFAREQHPELFQMAQAALLDTLAALPEEPPQHVLSQLDLLLGMRGQIAASLRPDFLARAHALAPMASAQEDDAQPRPPSGPPPRSPLSEPTRT